MTSKQMKGLKRQWIWYMSLCCFVLSELSALLSPRRESDDFEIGSARKKIEPEFSGKKTMSELRFTTIIIIY